MSAHATIGGQIEADLTDSGLYTLGPPHEVFDRLRRGSPVNWVAEPVRLRRNLRGRIGEVGGAGFWAVTGHPELETISADSTTFSSAERGADLFDPLDESDLTELRVILLNMDPPDHVRLRRLLQGAFTPRSINRLRERIHHECQAIVRTLRETGTGDFVTAAAAELPTRILADLLGMPQEDRHLLRKWSDAVIAAADPNFVMEPEAALMTLVEMYAYGHGIAEDRRQSPRDDLVSLMVNSEVDGDRLSEIEFDMFWILLVVAGNETTRNLLSGGMLALLQHDDERRRLWSNPSVLETGVAEMLRWVSPVNCFRRTAMHSTEVGGQRIEAGEKVVLFYGAANRDPRVFAEPHRFDLARQPNDHVAFGSGRHFCLGAHLARLEAQAFFSALVEETSSVELGGPVRHTPSTLINGIDELPVTISA